MTQKTRWFEYGEPTDDNRVEATIRTTYKTGPNEDAKPDDVQRGTVTYDALDVLEENDEIQQHVHDDGSVLLSALSIEAEDELLQTFEATNDEE